MPITDEKVVHKVFGLYFYFLKDFFFFFFFDVDHFFKVFIEFVTLLLLFCGLAF